MPNFPFYSKVKGRIADPYTDHGAISLILTHRIDSVNSLEQENFFAFHSVADQGCLSEIPDPTFSITGSWMQGLEDP